MAITTTIPTNLDFPSRGVLERDAFVNAQETAQDLLAGGYTTALNQYAVELNATQTDINTKAEQVANQAVTGSYSQAYIDATFTPKILNTQTDKATPIDADLIPLSDSASSFGLKKLSWLNIKATLKTYFDTLYVALTGNQTIDGVKTFSSSPIVPTPITGTQAVNKDYVDTGAGVAFVANDTRVKTALNATGNAPIYACRTWVNFNGTGTVAIKASGNVSSISDGGTGFYGINFIENMPNVNYSFCFGMRSDSDSTFTMYNAFAKLTDPKTVGYIYFRTMFGYNGATFGYTDSADVSVQIFGN